MHSSLAATLERETFAHGSVLQAFLVEETKGFFIADANLRLNWATPAAIESLRACGIADFSDTAAPHAIRLRAGLLRLLASGDPRHGGICCPKAAGEAHLLVRARRIKEDGATYLAGHLYLSSGQEVMALAQLEDAYQLTASEGKVVQLLFNGAGAAEISRQTGVSEGTVRTQIKAAYRKIGISSKEMLFRKLRPFISHC